jgi:hypothetical protein
MMGFWGWMMFVASILIGYSAHYWGDHWWLCFPICGGLGILSAELDYRSKK